MPERSNVDKKWVRKRGTRELLGKNGERKLLFISMHNQDGKLNEFSLVEQSIVSVLQKQLSLNSIHPGFADEILKLKTGKNGSKAKR